MMRLFLVFLWVAGVCGGQEPIRRAAFDIGSGKIKVQVADVDRESHRMINTVWDDLATVELREELSQKGHLSQPIQDQVIEALRTFKEKAVALGAVEFAAIATESLRLARNGEALACRIREELGIPMTIVSQEEEAILGFKTACALSQADPEHTVVWDTGAGSFQLTAASKGGYAFYLGKLGRVTMRNLVLEVQGKQVESHVSPHPISRQEAESALLRVKESLREVPEELQRKLKDPRTELLGMGLHPFGASLPLGDYDLGQVRESVERHLGWGDEEWIVEAPGAYEGEKRGRVAYVLSNQLLAYGLMEGLGFSKVRYVGTWGGNGVGVLLSPKYWQN